MLVQQKKKYWLLLGVIVWCGFSCVFRVDCIDVDSAIAGELQPLHSGYPEVFDVSGVIDYITDENIVINDSSYVFSSSVRFYDSRGVTGKVNFQVGSMVGVLLNDNRIIHTVWLIKKDEKRKKKEQVKLEPKSSGPVYYEDGVWTN